MKWIFFFCPLNVKGQVTPMQLRPSVVLDRPEQRLFRMGLHLLRLLYSVHSFNQRVQPDISSQAIL